MANSVRLTAVLVLIQFLNSGCSFLKNKITNYGSNSSLSVAEFSLSGAPSGVTTDSSLNIVVNPSVSLSEKLVNIFSKGSDDVQAATVAVSYIYKISNSDTCSNSTGYSAERSTSINITDDISLLSKGPVYICVIGINAQGQRSDPVKSVWTKGPLALSFSQVMGEVSENGSAVSVDINLDYPAHEDLVINLKSGGQAVAGSNYQALPSTITIPKGSTTYRLSVTPLNDSVTQAELNLNISLSDSVTSANVVAGEASQFKLWLTDVGASSNPVLEVSAGASHSCGITNAGVLKCWGDNTYGKLGDGTNQARSSPVVIDSGTAYSKVVAGANATCGITSAGVLKCWGYNEDGNLGDGTTTNRLSPVVINSGTSYQSVSLGSSYACGITAANVLKCWGDNASSQLGDGTITQRSTPVVIDSGVGYLHISASFYGESTCGITTSNVLKCWGHNASSQLGDGTSTMRSIPVIIDAGVSYLKVAQANEGTCGITTANVLKCWGYFSSTLSSFTPTAIDEGVNYQDITGGNSTTFCGISNTGVLKCWGYNTNGMLGDGTSNNINSPKTVDAGINYLKISVGGSHTCGITTAGILKCWGSNSAGQIGDGSASRLIPNLAESNLELDKVSVGTNHTCAIDSNKALRCWGLNSSAQLGDGSTTNKFNSIVIDRFVAFQQVSASSAHTCGITTAGVLKCWGSNTNGAIGDGTTTNRPSPVVVDSGVLYSKVSAGNGFTCAITVDGVLKCWGGNTVGRLGNGNTTNQLLPIVIDSGVSYSFIEAGSHHTCGITTAGVLKCWGWNGYSQLGDGTSTNRFLPIVIDSGVSYLSVSLKNTEHTCGITTAGVLKCWGYNINGQLGDSTQTIRSTPVVADSGTSYLSVGVGYRYTCGVTVSGVLKCWGLNNSGQIGNGNLLTDWLYGGVLTPTVIDSGQSYVSVHAYSLHTCGITSSNKLKCWGSNSYGQLGGGSSNYFWPSTIVPGMR